MRPLLAYLAVLLSLAAAAGCTTEDHADSTNATGSSTGPWSSPESGSQEVILDELRYECGPNDDTVVSFRLSADAPVSGTAQLVVHGETYGPLGVDIGPLPTAYTMEIDLTQDAYSDGEGEIRVQSGSGDLLATEPVQLRLPSGTGCG